MRRMLAFLFLAALLTTACAQAEDARWLETLHQAYPEWEVVRESDIGDGQGVIAVLRRDAQVLTVIVDGDAAGEPRFHVNGHLFGDHLPQPDELWLNSATDPAGEPPRPFLWYQPQAKENGFYISLHRDPGGSWNIRHAEFGESATASFCAYDVEGIIATVRGETLYPQVRTLLTVDLAFADFDPAAVQAHCRAILAAPEAYRCYGLDCMEDGPCREHLIYTIEAEELTSNNKQTD